MAASSRESVIYAVNKETSTCEQVYSEYESELDSTTVNDFELDLKMKKEKVIDGDVVRRAL